MRSDAWDGEVRKKDVEERKVGEERKNKRTDSRRSDDRGSREIFDRRSRRSVEIGII